MSEVQHLKGIHGIHLRISQTLSWGSLQRIMSGALFGLIALILAPLHMSHSLAVFSSRAQFHNALTFQSKRSAWEHAIAALAFESKDYFIHPGKNWYSMVKMDQRQTACLQLWGGASGGWYNKLNVLWLNAFLCPFHLPISKISVVWRPNNWQLKVCNSYLCFSLLPDITAKRIKWC